LKLPPIDIDRAMKCQLDQLPDFCKRYDISVDWLLFGDLKGLRRMTLPKPPKQFLTATELLTFWNELTMDQRKRLTITMIGMVQAAGATE
jgi:hypothetical protein